MILKAKKITVDVRYSSQAQAVAAHIKDFDESDFLNWFFNQSPYTQVGSTHLTHYLAEKK